ncbi:MAG: sugar ABC transporter permease [Chloroflexi bacterium HGW-Chloroflexi-1]|nr:MAG: sugar ABC transporter permease [Chloroflexi bacterium HGW-Chloroflexi-1]
MTAKRTVMLPRLILYGLVYLLTALWLAPVATAVITSLRANSDILLHGFLSIPNTLSLQSYVDAWQRGGLAHYLPNSFIITLPSLAATLFLSSLAGYALSRFRFPGDRLILFIFVAGMMLPFQILLLPVFRLTDALHLYNTCWAVIIFHTAFQLGFCTFVLRNYMRTIPGEILEAARMDGCNEFRIYSQIMLPLTLPALAALATLEFTWIFNDFLWALILIQNDALKPVTTGLASLRGQYVMDWTVIISGSLIAALPTVLVFLFLQRYFIGGLTLGATKG